MATLSTALFDCVVRLLLPFMGTEDDRQAELLPVVHGRPVNDRIRWEGPAKQFTVQLVRLLSHNELLTVLRRLSVGEELRAEVADVCARIEQEARTPQPAVVIETPHEREEEARSVRVHISQTALMVVLGVFLLALFAWTAYRCNNPPESVTGTASGTTTGSDTTSSDTTTGSDTTTSSDTTTAPDTTAPDTQVAVPDPGRVAGPTRFWTDAIVPFIVAPDLPSQSRITDAIAHVEEKTNVRFVPRTNEANYVQFVYGTGCGSSVGMIGGAQKLVAGSGCTTGTVIHDIGHTLGLYHEEARSDRDQYVQIHWDKIAPGMDHNFRIVRDSANMRRGPYDYGSIMHMPSTAFSIDRSPTITPLTAGVMIGQRVGLSPSDIALINRLYPAATAGTAAVR